MEIDIISFTDTQFAALSEAQIMEVKSAQQKKNKLAEKMAETKRKEKARLVENGTFVSRLWDLFCLEQEEKFAVEVENIRDALLFYLRFSARPEEGTAEETPYVVDYSLSMQARVSEVKSYYESTYTDGAERFTAFVADTVAPTYLGELYAPLYDYFQRATQA